MPPPPRPRPLTPAEETKSPAAQSTPGAASPQTFGSPPDAALPQTFQSPSDAASSNAPPAPPTASAPWARSPKEFEHVVGEPRTARLDHEQPQTTKTCQDIVVEQLEAAAAVGNADALYQLFLNRKMCPEDPAMADADRAAEYLDYAYENNMFLADAMQVMRSSRWGYDGELNAKARESGDLRPGAKPQDYHEWSGIRPGTPSRPGTTQLRPDTKGSMGSMGSFRTDATEEPPKLLEGTFDDDSQDDSQATWLTEANATAEGDFPEIETIPTLESRSSLSRRSAPSRKS